MPPGGGVLHLRAPSEAVKTRFGRNSEFFSQTKWVFAQKYELHSSYLLENVINTCKAIFSEMFGHNDFDSKSFTWFMLYLRHLFWKLMYPQFWFTTSSSCSEMFGHNDFDSKSFTSFMPYLRHLFPKLMYPQFWITTSSSCSDTMTWWWHCHFQVFLLTSFRLL